MQEAGSSRHDQQLLAWIGSRESLVTAAEATVGVGLPLDAVEARLLALAVASGAQLQVSGAGEVAYRFPAHLRSLTAVAWFRRGLIQAEVSAATTNAAVRPESTRLATSQIRVHRCRLRL